MASYNKNIDSGFTTQVQGILQGLGADLGAGGVDGKWGAYTDAAYNQYKDQVDAALAGNGGNGVFTGYYDLTGHSHAGGYSAPKINYTPRTLDELMAEAQGLIGGEYDAQLLAAKQGYEASQQSLAKAYEGTRKTTQDSAVSRGMGRSSYLTDAIANVGLHEKQDAAQLAGNYGDQVMTLEKAQAEAISSYVQQLQRQQEQMALEVALAQAELQYKYDALNASLAQNASASGGYSVNSSGGSGGKKTGSANNNVLTDDYVSSLAAVASNPVSSNSFLADHLARSASNLASKGKVPEANSYVNQYNALTGSKKPQYVDLTSKDNISSFVRSADVQVPGSNLVSALTGALGKIKNFFN
jgi:hypothetical protein